MTDDLMIRWWKVSTRGSVSLVPIFLKKGKSPKDSGTAKHFPHFVTALNTASDALDRRVHAARRELERQTALAKSTRDRWRRDFADEFETHGVDV